MRDMSKVIQGVIMSNQKSFGSAESVIRLWCHECQRVFADRMIKSTDETIFRQIISSTISDVFQKEWSSVMSDACEPKTGPLFCGFMNESDQEYAVSYEEIIDIKTIKTFLEDKLDEYNLDSKNITMPLALFHDAIKHILRIHRVLSLDRGNIMLVGNGGSGRSSLTRLSAFIAGMKIFTIEIKKNYKLVDFREDMKKLYMQAGCENNKIVFLFNDTQVSIIVQVLDYFYDI
jgi:dynein heavy chain